MSVETCGECGFDGAAWTDESALAALEGLPDRWASGLDGLKRSDLRRRPVPEMWSIGEYTDHVREVIFGMRFVLDSALADPGSDLGAPPESRFDPEPRGIDVARALDGFRQEVRQLCFSLRELPSDRWTAWVTVDGTRVDAHWIVRHAVHDVTHHLDDVDRLRAALG